jgi:hypothetical protein
MVWNLFNRQSQYDGMMPISGYGGGLNTSDIALANQNNYGQGILGIDNPFENMSNPFENMSNSFGVFSDTPLFNTPSTTNFDIDQFSQLKSIGLSPDIARQTATTTTPGTEGLLGFDNPGLSGWLDIGKFGLGLYGAKLGRDNYKLAKKGFEHQRNMDLNNLYNTIAAYGDNFKRKHTQTYLTRGYGHDEAERLAQQRFDELNLKTA